MPILFLLLLSGSNNMEKIGKLTFNRTDILGSGKYGTVLRGKFKDLFPVAVKRVEKINTVVDAPLYRKAQDHPNIIQFYYFKDKDVKFR